MITADGWFDWAVRDPGPADKVYTERCTSLGVVLHSAVGYYNGWHSRLFDLSRDENGRYTPYAAASVTGFIRYDGTLIQHYPITASCWASGNRHANTTFNAFEEEGGHNPEHEPLRDPQVATSVRIIREIAELKDWTPNRLSHPPIRSLWEHNECVEVWGGAPTACPSSRIPWATIVQLSTAEPVKEPEEVYKLMLQSGSKFVYLVCYNAAKVAIWKRYVKAGPEFDYWSKKLGPVGVQDLRAVPAIA